MKVLLVYPDFPSSATSTTEEWGFYSEGLASLSAVLKGEGHQVSLLHLSRRVEMEDFFSRVKSRDPDLIGFSVRTSNFPSVREYIVRLKEEVKTPVVCGSYHATLASEEVIATPGVDMVCIGEGEETFRELCDRLERGRPYGDIASLWVRRNGDLVKNHVRPLVEDLDTIPIPDFDLFDFDNLTSSKIFTAGVMLSRGCPFSCTYCCNHRIRNIYPNREKYARKRTPENGIRYVQTLLEAHPSIRYLTIWDNDFAWPKDWFREFIPLYRDRVKLPFSCNLHPNNVDEEIVEGLKEAGCHRVHIGVENGNEEFRRRVLKRPISDQQMIRVFGLFREAGIGSLAYNIINMPGETPLISLDTVKLNAVMHPTVSLAPVFYPYPGTEAYTVARAGEMIESNAFDAWVRNERYSHAKVRFFSLYFRHLIALYRFIYRLPGGEGGVADRTVTRILASRLLPHRLLNGLMRGGRNLKSRSKNLLKNRFPGVYVALRDRVLSRRAG